MTPDPGNERSGSWIYTYTGTKFDVLDPDPKAIDPMDIAHSLATQARFTGHCREPYSTAQHSYMVSTIVPADDALWGLLHDASETYLSDIASPIKRQGDFSFYKEIEGRLLEAVSIRFGLSMPVPPSVKAADDMMLRAEQRDLMPNDPSPGPIYKDTIEPWSWQKAKSFFLARYSELTGDVYEAYYSPGERGLASRKQWRHVTTTK